MTWLVNPIGSNDPMDKCGDLCGLDLCPHWTICGVRCGPLCCPDLAPTPCDLDGCIVYVSGR